MKKTFATVAIAASTLGGVAAGATVLGPGLAGAQDGDDAEAPAEHEAGSRLADALQPLVDDGTITDAQRDAVVDQLVAEMPARGERGFRGGPRGFGGGADIAEILGVEPAEIREALAAGDSLADLATANDVDPRVLVDAIVAATEERVETARENGRIDEERAAEILAGAEERATDLVNGDVEFERRGPRGRFGPGPSDAADADTADAGVEA